MNQTKRRFELTLTALLAFVAGCAPNADTTTEIPVSPTKEFSIKTSFGDGYIAHVPSDDVEQKSEEEILTLLVTQWLEHYKTDSTMADAMIKDYKLDQIYIERENDQASIITALVEFSIIPAKTPNIWASLPGTISPNDPWWHLAKRAGISADGHYLWLRFLLPKGVMNDSKNQVRANKACTCRMGVCAIYEHFSGFEFFLLPSLIHARPHADNANLWIVG